MRLESTETSPSCGGGAGHSMANGRAPSSGAWSDRPMHPRVEAPHSRTCVTNRALCASSSRWLGAAELGEGVATGVSVGAAEQDPRDRGFEAGVDLVEECERG